MGFDVEQKVGFQVGQTVGNYEFLDLLSSSPTEIAYKVRNHLTQRLEALKVLAAESAAGREAVERFIREIKVHARLTHPNIVTFYNAAELEGQLVMTLELVNGITLADRLRLMGALSWIEAVSHISQVLMALGFAHEQGIIHRNVTPDSILLTADTTVKLTGFDLAKPMASPSLTQAGSVMGALKYIPPEQIRGVGELDARSDLYSAGVVLYEALTGRLPFDSSSQFKVMMDHVNTRPAAPSSINPKVPPEFDSLLLKALAKDPADRFQSADEFRARLEGIKNAMRARPGAPMLNSPSLHADALQPALNHPQPVQPETVDLDGDVPTFGIATQSAPKGRNFLLLALGLSSLLIGVAVALLLAVAKL